MYLNSDPFHRGVFTDFTQAHYQQVWNVPLLHPNIFGVRIGRDAVIPAELCDVVPGQLYRKKIPADMGADFLRFATQKPAARLKSIVDAVSGTVSCLMCCVECLYIESCVEPGFRLQVFRLRARGWHGS